ncbi:DUF2798 domain-containing protein [Bacillus sp. SD075]|uniref:DUF2798 domain-containing protein n=1 Tax=Bacillus sp. SD075 TaxID=2781732 RepID=UPI001A963B08|nr:DUF2798 domain-containing protein [Bacillus sp. SD075]MBO0998414.1 DUF2798 domain-containing protein [Bacillus sp. SD075]
MSMNIKYRKIIYAFLMSFSMSFFISFILVSINRGYDHTFLSIWLKTWSQAFICAFFGAYFFPGVIQQIMGRINFVEKPSIIEKDFLVREEDNG